MTRSRLCAEKESERAFRRTGAECVKSDPARPRGENGMPMHRAAHLAAHCHAHHTARDEQRKKKEKERESERERARNGKRHRRKVTEGKHGGHRATRHGNAGACAETVSGAEWRAGERERE